MFSLFVGGGQDYHGPTAERDERVVAILAQKLREHPEPFQIITGGTEGIPDKIARTFSAGHNKTVVDVISDEYFPKYAERTKDCPSPHWIAGATNAERRMFIATAHGIKVALFIQGGQYTAHEILLFQRHNPRCSLVIFTGSGGASGGEILHEGERYAPQKRLTRAYDSTDPDASSLAIAQELYDDIFQVNQSTNQINY